ncbi:hypothetical protein J6590_073637 [Homalodisca vitripennis]|nr:hypothetical protein J6590_073637 [Homalodisca vitripennis]
MSDTLVSGQDQYCRDSEQRSNLSQQSRNARRLRNVVNNSNEEEREIGRQERRVGMARLRASQSQEQREEARETARLAMRNRRANRTDQQLDQV